MIKEDPSTAEIKPDSLEPTEEPLEEKIIEEVVEGKPDASEIIEEGDLSSAVVKPIAPETTESTSIDKVDEVKDPIKPVNLETSKVPLNEEEDLSSTKGNNIDQVSKATAHIDTPNK